MGAVELDGVPLSAGDALPLGLINYGHFTSMLVEDCRVKGLWLHLERLQRDCQQLFDTDLNTDSVRQLVRHYAEQSAGQMVVRVTVYDPALELGKPGVPAQPRILVTTRAGVAHAPAPFAVKSTVYERDLPQVKHVGLFGTIHHRRQAQLAGYDDVLFTDAAGQISEGATWNIGFWDGTRVTWPASPVLPGVAMHLVREVLSDVGIESVEAPVHLSVAQSATMAFATNAIVGMRQIAAINDLDLPGDDRFLIAIQKAYAALIPALL